MTNPDCLHCQVCKTLMEYSERTGDFDLDTLINALGNVFGDMVTSAPHNERRELIEHILELVARHLVEAFSERDMPAVPGRLQ